MPSTTLAIDLDATEALNKVVLDLLNEFPAAETYPVQFATLAETFGVGFYPSSGAVFDSNIEDIVGHVRQRCRFSFDIVYRSAPKKETQKMRAQEYLDVLGRWLEQQPVIIGGTEYRLKSYPKLEVGNRRILSIARDGASHLNAAYEDGVEDWAESISMIYENEYQK